jgi:uncharacterized membrane protein YoaK (UPF0700 family)
MLQNLISIILLTTLSGICDAVGFLHASRIWQKDNSINCTELWISAAGFAAGVSLYWLAVKYLQIAGITSPELQTTCWFAMTIIGVAIANHQFAKWVPLDQLIAVAVLCGIAWLIMRHS